MGVGRKSSGKCVIALITGIGREAAERAERAEFHRVAEIGQQREVLLRGSIARGDPVDRLDAAHRADAAGRALAAAFDRAELHGEAGLLQHVGGVVEDDDAAMADQPVLAAKAS